jgi:uncharacterized membrane protein
MRIIEKIKSNYWIILIIILGAALRFYHIDFQSIWLDEIHTMIEGNPSLPYSEFYDLMLLREQMPHLYYNLVRFFSLIFGHTTFNVRMVSAILGVVSIYSIYLLAKEIANKKTGYFAAILLSVNYFHIWYSQEARPYVLLALCTILSYYRLLVFLKNITYKNAFFYGLFTALMINTHFFGLFVLVSQVLVILYFIFEDEKQSWKKNIYASLVAGLTTIILWIPSIPIFLIVTKIKSFWIQPPTAEVYLGLFKEFFGYAESLIFIASIISCYYFIKVFSSKYDKKENKNNNIVFGFIIISVWVFITLLIPYIRTYVDVPMIISRYFISVLPAAILIVAIGIERIKSSIIQYVIISFFIVSSLVDLFLVKDYYNKITKTQYREMSQKVIEKNKLNNAKIYSIWGWHLRHFFTNDIVKMETKEQTLEEVIQYMKSSPENKKDFWFIGAHFQKFELSSESEAYLNSNFNLIENIEYYDTWARYYAPKDGIESAFSFDINEFEPIKSDNDVNILLFSNSTTTSKPVTLDSGLYRLAIKAKSLPDPPINNENAHLTVQMNDKKIGAYFVNEKIEETNFFQFQLEKEQEVTISITFGNDLVLNNNDRNVLVYSVIIEKIKK